MALNVTASLEGIDAAMAALARVEKAVRRKGTRAAANAATAILLPEAKARVPSRTGHLKRSLARKVRMYQGVAVGLVGPRSNFKVTVGTRMRGKNVGKPVVLWAGKYAAQVEKGTSRSAAKPFLQPAFDASAGRMSDAMASAVLAAVEGA